jgi:hypothetical protein
MPGSISGYKTAGTMNFPYSNFIGFLSELGIIFFSILTFLIFRFYIKNRKLLNDKRFFDFTFIYIMIFAFIYHEFEQTPIMALCLYLFILTFKENNIYNLKVVDNEIK